MRSVIKRKKTYRIKKVERTKKTIKKETKSLKTQKRFCEKNKVFS